MGDGILRAPFPRPQWGLALVVLINTYKNQKFSERLIVPDCLIPLQIQNVHLHAGKMFTRFRSEHLFAKVKCLVKFQLSPAKINRRNNQCDDRFLIDTIEIRSNIEYDNLNGALLLPVDLFNRNLGVFTPGVGNGRQH